MNKYSEPWEILVFSYGTLQYENILQGVLGRRWTGWYEPAILYGYKLLDTAPKFIIPQDDEKVNGFIIHDLDKGDLINIDYYEGVQNGMYERRTVKINNRPIQVYIAGQGIMPYLNQIED